MQDLFIAGILGVVALGLVLIKSIMFIIHMLNIKTSNEIISNNVSNVRKTNMQMQQMQNTISSIESVMDWKTEDPKMTDDFRHQFLAKTKTRRTPTSDRASTRERVPLATTDFGDPDDDFDNSIPIYTYNPSVGGTQV